MFIFLNPCRSFFIYQAMGLFSYFISKNICFKRFRCLFNISWPVEQGVTWKKAWSMHVKGSTNIYKVGNQNRSLGTHVSPGRQHSLTSWQRLAHLGNTWCLCLLSLPVWHFVYSSRPETWKSSLNPPPCLQPTSSEISNSTSRF